MSRTATRKALLKRAAELRCGFEDNGETLHVDVPRGFIFAGPQVHMLTIFYGDSSWLKPEAYAALLDDMSMGIERCANPGCDYCTEDLGD